MSKKKVILLGTFARSFSPALLLVTVSCLWLGTRFGTGIFAPLFYFKAASSAMVFCVADKLKAKEYCYYHNLGLDRRALWVPVLAADMLSFTILLLVFTLW